jgi:hypothetical protein
LSSGQLDKSLKGLLSPPSQPAGAVAAVSPFSAIKILEINMTLLPDDPSERLFPSAIPTSRPTQTANITIIAPNSRATAEPSSYYIILLVSCVLLGMITLSLCFLLGIYYHHRTPLTDRSDLSEPSIPTSHSVIIESRPNNVADIKETRSPLANAANSSDCEEDIESFRPETPIVPPPNQYKASVKPGSAIQVASIAENEQPNEASQELAHDLTREDQPIVGLTDFDADLQHEATETPVISKAIEPLALGHIDGEPLDSDRRDFITITSPVTEEVSKQSPSILTAMSEGHNSSRKIKSSKAANRKRKYKRKTLIHNGKDPIDTSQLDSSVTTV